MGNTGGDRQKPGRKSKVNKKEKEHFTGTIK